MSEENPLEFLVLTDAHNRDVPYIKVIAPRDAVQHLLATLIDATGVSFDDVIQMLEEYGCDMSTVLVMSKMLQYGVPARHVYQARRKFYQLRHSPKTDRYADCSFYSVYPDRSTTPRDGRPNCWTYVAIVNQVTEQVYMKVVLPTHDARVFVREVQQRGDSGFNYQVALRIVRNMELHRTGYFLLCKPVSFGELPCANLEAAHKHFADIFHDPMRDECQKTVEELHLRIVK